MNIPNFDPKQEDVAKLLAEQAKFPLIEAALAKAKSAGLDTTVLEQQYNDMKKKINQYLAVYGPKK